MEGKYCILRTKNAGIHCGFVESVVLMQDSACVRITHATRLYRWMKHKDGTLSLSGVALHGAGQESRIDGILEESEIFGVIELLPCTETAKAFLMVPRNNT